MNENKMYTYDLNLNTGRNHAILFIFLFTFLFVLLLFLLPTVRDNAITQQKSDKKAQELARKIKNY